MKFQQFKQLRDTLIEKNIINESVKSYNDYSEIFREELSVKEAEEAIDKLFDEESPLPTSKRLRLVDLTEEELFEKEDNILAKLFKNIIGRVKMKSAGKSYVKALTDEAAVELDYARRKKAAGKKNKDAADAETLKAAHDAKKSALQDRTRAIAEKIDSIATTDYLKKLASQVKLTARMKKNEALLKIASKEEAAELKLKNAELNSDLQKTQGELRNYEKTEAAQKEEAKEKELPKIKDQIKKLNPQIDEITGKIEAIESSQKESEEDDAKKAEALQKLLPLVKQKAELLGKRAELKTVYNELADAEEDEYNPEEDFTTKGNLEQTAEEITKRIEKLGTKDSDAPGGEGETGPKKGEGEGEGETGPKKGEGEGEGETGPKKGEGEGETGPKKGEGEGETGPKEEKPEKKEDDEEDLYADTESGRKAKEIDAKLKDMDKQHSDLKKQLEDLPDIGDMTDDDKKKADEINAKIEKLKNQAKEMNRKKNEILSGLSKESEQPISNRKMTFEEYCNRPR